MRRIERGVRFSLVARQPLTADEIAALLAPLLHDRMTQTLLDREALPATLFAVQARRGRCASIPLLQRGPAGARARRSRPGPRAVCRRDRATWRKSSALNGAIPPTPS